MQHRVARFLARCCRCAQSGVMAEKAAPQTQQPVTGVSSLERAVSAFVGYSCGAVVVLPFDRVKSLLQVSCQRAASVQLHQRRGCTACPAESPSAAPAHRAPPLQVSPSARAQGALPLARQIWATQGLRGLYMGGGPHMLIAPYTVLYYSMYDELRCRGKP